MTDHYLLFDAETRGGHVHVTVRAGDRSEARALAGTLVLRPGEWEALRAVLARERSVDHDWLPFLEVRERE